MNPRHRILSVIVTVLMWGSDVTSVWAVTTCDPSKPHLVNPLTGDCGPISPFELFGRGIKTLLLLIGSLSLVFSIYGGFLWLTSGGNTERIQQGKDTLMWAILGVVVALFSYVILNFILNALLPVA